MTKMKLKNLSACFANLIIQKTPPLPLQGVLLQKSKSKQSFLEKLLQISIPKMLFVDDVQASLDLETCIYRHLSASLPA